MSFCTGLGVILHLEYLVLEISIRSQILTSLFITDCFHLRGPKDIIYQLSKSEVKIEVTLFLALTRILP